jgi:hypothetical protein
VGVPVSSVFSATLRSGALIAPLLVVAGCASVSPRPAASTSIERLSATERVAHVLSRLTFGPRSGDAERVAAMGVDRWIDRQLQPETIPDSALAVALAGNPSWNVPATRVAAIPVVPRSVSTMPMAAMVNDSSARAILKLVAVRLGTMGGANDFFYAGKIIHAQVGERQLLEVISDFWENHFSVYSGKMPSPEALIVWDRDVLRPNALGKFRDLLGATAHSPAMLYYLDNHLSTRQGLNENYARELLELHTLGVDGGYTQQDVIEVARALTGWSINRNRELGGFSFRADQHDTGTKTVLGHTLRGGRGVEDGEEVLDILARHPSTARHIAFKLARRLVSDEPPASLVNRAAATYTRTDGDIAQVVRTIVTSPEFFSKAAFRAKVKTPFELVVATLRALDAPADTSIATARAIAQLGQPTFAWVTPEGWPETGSAWMNSGAIYKRIKFGGDIADGHIAYAPLAGWRDWASLSALPLNAQIDGVVKDVLGGAVEPETRKAILAVGTDVGVASNVADGPSRLRALLAIAFASPEFQRR